jgi:GTP cyclohydrolase I
MKIKPIKPFKAAGYDHFAEEAKEKAEDAVKTLIEYVGEDPNNPGLLETPKRVVKALLEQNAGYQQDPAIILAKDFDGGKYDEMILLRNIEFYSTCCHHLLPFFGSAHVAYLPNRKNPRVVGLSKLARLVDCFAKRLQIQEQLTAQIADSIEEHLQSAGVGVVIEARHFCMCCRGVQKHQSTMINSALRGVFKNEKPRAEFLALVNLGTK